MDGERVAGGTDEPRSGALRVARAQPVGRNIKALEADLHERLPELPVQRAPAQPRHVGVERLPAQRVAEARAAVAEVVQDAVALQLGQALLGGESVDQLERERLTRHRGRLGGRPGRFGQRRRAHQHGIAHRVGHRDLAVVAELEPAPARLQAAAHRERAGELLDAERHALRAVVERTHQRRRRRRGQQRRQQLAGAVEVERGERDLLQLAAATQLVPQPAQRVVARQAVRAVGADHEHGQLGERGRQRAQQRERRLVRPLEVVEHDDRGPELLEGAADRLEDRRAVAAGRRLAELRDEQREVGAQRAEPVEPVRARAEVRAQDRDQRPVRRRAGAARRAAEDQRRRGLRSGLVGQPGLADARLARQQHERAAARQRVGGRAGEQRALGLTTEKRAASVHGGEA